MITKIANESSNDHQLTGAGCVHDAKQPIDKMKVSEMIGGKLLLVTIGREGVVFEWREHLACIAKQKVQRELQPHERCHELKCACYNKLHRHQLSIAIQIQPHSRTRWTRGHIARTPRAAKCCCLCGGQLLHPRAPVDRLE
jgi:hypothetical protein